MAVSTKRAIHGADRVLMMAICKAAAEKPKLGAVLLDALAKAVRSGSAGFAAGTMQVLAFMWLRTAMNYQYKFGGTLMQTLGTLYAEGGIARLYRGLFPWAIFQAPLSRFGDVASNDMALAVVSHLLPQSNVSFQTFVGSMAGAGWRIVITPVDTCKTILQTDGSKGWKILLEKVKKNGIFTLWAGWEGNYVANVVGNYPWFYTMNLLQAKVPIPEGKLMKHIRTAVLGAVASSVSDIVSNCIRVIKTKKQTHENADVGYIAATKEIFETDGLYGILFRGLETRIFTNILQTAFFTVLWKALSGQV